MIDVIEIVRVCGDKCKYCNKCGNDYKIPSCNDCKFVDRDGSQFPCCKCRGILPNTNKLTPCGFIKRR